MSIPKEYFKAGAITKAVKNWIKGRVTTGTGYLEICEDVEKEIIARGGKPAFPCAIGVNDVTAHYAPQPGEERRVVEKDVVKVDFGTHVDGYIVDTSVTFTDNAEYETLLESTERALNAAIEVARHDPRVGEIGRAIGSEASKHGFKTISNLSGHTLDRYVVHAGKSIPNLYMPNLPTLKKNEVFAVEPFLTLGNAAGYVVDAPQQTIFSLAARRRLGNTELDEAVQMIWDLRRTLPFTPRWFLENYTPEKLQAVLRELVKSKVVRSYSTLVEASGKPVAQFEHTAALDDGGLIVLT
ncbi:MAG: type II methionyl aminopeptidase [Thaumarchaeota archaeon]|nr:type II methionyl aminopeptidase [Nitrososphaerota archaeon]